MCAAGRWICGRHNPMSDRFLRTETGVLNRSERSLVRLIVVARTYCSGVEEVLVKFKAFEKCPLRDFLDSNGSQAMHLGNYVPLQIASCMQDAPGLPVVIQLHDDENYLKEGQWDDDSKIDNMELLKCHHRAGVEFVTASVSALTRRLMFLVLSSEVLLSWLQCSKSTMDERVQQRAAERVHDGLGLWTAVAPLMEDIRALVVLTPQEQSVR